MNYRFPTRILALAACLTAFAGQSAAQGFSPERMAEDALAEPFVGLTTDGVPLKGLYHLRSTGDDSAPVSEAARSLLDTLTSDESARVRFPMDSPEWRHWANFHRFPGRGGLMLEEMSDPQRSAVMALLDAGLSAKGYRTARDIMRLNHHLGELTQNFDEYGEHKYWIALFGDPSDGAPWGWQFEGHHLILNYALIGDRLVMTPAFLGSEPVRAERGRYAGTEVLQPEQDAGLALMRALPATQQALARIGAKEGRASAVAELFRDNVVVPVGGLPAAEMSPEHRAELLSLIGLFVGNQPGAQAAVTMAEVAAHIEETHFAWRGETGDEAVFYFRIHSPVIFIEFDHQGPIALGRGAPTRDHVHAVIRTPNGGDYGKDLLSQHYHAMDGDTEHGHGVRP